MKLSTRGIYGLRAICYIAENETCDPISLSTISSELGISENYLEQLVRLLKKADFVESIRGSHGGYRLKGRAEDIRVLDILKTLEGEVQPLNCNSKDICSDVTICPAHVVMAQMMQSISAGMNDLMLSDLINKGEYTLKNSDSL